MSDDEFQPIDWKALALVMGLCFVMVCLVGIASYLIDWSVR